MWRPCLLIDRDKMGNLYREPSIDASYQVSVHLAKRFRGQHFQKSINQKQELPMVAIFVNGSGRNMQSLQRTSHRCILLSFGSFGKAVSEEKIFQKSSNQKQELSMVAIFVNGQGRNKKSQQRTFHRCFLPSFCSFGKAFQRRRFLEIDQLERRIACGSYIC